VSSDDCCSAAGSVYPVLVTASCAAALAQAAPLYLSISTFSTPMSAAARVGTGSEQQLHFPSVDNASVVRSELDPRCEL
jgi:hypothetical protein